MNITQNNLEYLSQTYLSYFQFGTREDEIEDLNALKIPEIVQSELELIRKIIDEKHAHNKKVHNGSIKHL